MDPSHGTSRLVHEAFRQRVREAPGSLAVVDGSRQVTYRQLDRESDVLARALGLRAGGLVGVRLERSADLVVALLAVLKAGCGYVVLDPAFPAERLRAMAADAGVAAVVTRSGLPPVGLDVPHLRVDHVEAGSGEVRPPVVGPESVACVMFTSGSTGRPKGVVAPHGAVTATVTGQGFASFGPGSVWLQASPVSWDAFALELWGPLLGGGTCVLHPGQRPDPVVIARLVAEHRVTSAYLSASLFNVVVDEFPRALDGVREVLVGGEALSPAHLRRARELWPSLRIGNGYGPVEAMVFVTVHPVADADADGPVPIGRPLPGKRAYVLDDRLRPVPDGETGELYAAGAGLALGYLGLPGATAERFLPDPYGEPGTRMYRTGDLARRRRDGVLEFAGRTDDQVKVRGFRVEPAEVEAALARHPGVARAVVLARPDATGELVLVAYATPATGARLDPEPLRRHAERLLPGHLVPGAFVVLDALPLLASGKLDRAALPQPARPEGSGGPGVGSGPADPLPDTTDHPGTPLVRQLCALFSGVLGVPDVGPDDDFFALGGQSLLVARLLGRIVDALGAEVDVRTFFGASTPAKLAAVLAAAPGRRPSAPEGPPPASHRLSPAEQRLWFLDRTDAGVAYTLPLLVRLRGAVDAGALGRALDAVVRRHDALRTVYEERADGTPVRRVVAEADARVPFVHRVVPEAAWDAAVRDAARHRFDLTAELPVRAALFTVRERPDEHGLLLALHHIAADGWSLPPLLRDLSRAYRGEALPPAEAPYAVHSARGRERVDQLRDGQLAYWREALAGSRAPLLPRGPGGPGGSGAPDAAVTVRRTGAGGHARLVALARERGATLFMVLHTALAAVLVRAGAGTDTLVAAPVAGRGGGGADDAVGFFVNLLALRADASGDPSAAELLERVREGDLAAFAHQDVPFEDVVEALNPPRGPGRHPFTDVVLALQNNARAELDLPGAQADPVEVVRTGAARFDLLVDVTDRYGPDGAPLGLELTLEYRTRALEPEVADWLADALVTTLDALVRTPDDDGPKPDTLVRTPDAHDDLRLSRLPLPPLPHPADTPEPAPEPTRAPAGPYAPPRTDAERRVAGVFADVLGAPRVGAHDDFFAIGGNSLRALRVAARLTTASGRALTAEAVFAAPTVAGLAAALEAAGADGAPGAGAPIPRRA
ncbi:amino acid adenylation domain-containing protein, partial [Streptomyces sp. NPDC001941]|uniref:amino acid adenylation domain-containing protein n=1 Tax=Streptomyces sp. NPDC001941 TaxID=3154659 RepID=UPI0033213A10